MIDPHWILEDLDPYTWRAIGKFFPPGQYIQAGTPDERGLFVVHDKGKVLSVIDSRTKETVPFAQAVVDAPTELAQSLLAGGGWDRVHVIDRSHLQSVAHRAQQIENRSLHLDEYYRMVYEMVWDGSEGYVALPPHPGHWNHWTYAGIRAFADQFEELCSIGLGVVRDNEVVIGLISEIGNGTIRRVTTFESLDIDRFDGAVNQEFFVRIWNGMSSRFASPAAVLLCTDLVFDEWIGGGDKRAVIERAISSGQAICKAQSWVTPEIQGVLTG